MCNQQFVLRWHYHEATILGNLPVLLESNMLTDLTISVEQGTVKAHKVVLALCSSYFFQLFQNMDNIQNPVIVLHNVAMEDIKAVLQFIYKGQCVVGREQLPSLLSVAKLLKIQGLCDMKVPESTDDNTQNSLSLETDQDETCSVDTSKSRSKVEILAANHGEPSEFSSLASLNNKRNSTTSSCSTLWETSILGKMTNKNLHRSTPTNLDRTQKKYNSISSNNKELSESCKCFLCGKYLSNQYNLRVHIETHEEAYYACQSCPHVSRSRDALRKHVSYRHPQDYHSRKHFRKLKHRVIICGVR